MAPKQKVLIEACEELARRDRALARAYAETGVPEWRARPARYETIARTIAFQQISTKAAATIWGRVEAHLGEITPEAMDAADEEALRACGLSRPKVGHLKSIASAVLEKRLCFDRLHSADLDDARAELTAVKGIGPWTAELYCMCAKGALDACPSSDIGLSESWRQLSGVDERPDIKAFAVIMSEWAPYRGVAAHLLWAWINAQRGGE